MVQQKNDALNVQIRQLETVLRRPDNNVCADCPGKTPRWASITFGTFVCLRCSGQHRALGVHITKIKSVNLDKWPEGKVTTFQALSNNLVNAYWEANLPKNFSKPGPSAPTSEVTRFLNQKYVEKKWVDTDMKYDPLYLFENKRSRFDKFVKRCMNAAGIGSESEEEPAPKKSSKKLQKAPQAAAQAPAAPASQPQQAIPDLFSMTPAAEKPTEQFTEFISATPAAPKTDDGFTDFQGGQQQQPANNNNNQQQQQMINNIMQMMGQNNSQQMAQNMAASQNNAKYSAFDQMGAWGNNPGQSSQQPTGMQGMAGMGMGAQSTIPQQTSVAQPGAFQPQFFNSALQQQQSNYQNYGQHSMPGGQPQQQPQQQQWQATFNTGGQQPQAQPGFQNQGFTQGAQGGFGQPGNMFAGMQPPKFNTGAPSQPQNNQNMGGFGGFQNAPQMATGQPQGGQYYNGLVNLAPSGQPQTGAFVGGAQPGNQTANQSSLNNLVKW